ncbi:MAG: hypothetical protein H0U37_08000 [Chloroflexi bacterium]|nr:hypothetical protein [Chloroflexota bacterium]
MDQDSATGLVEVGQLDRVAAASEPVGPVIAGQVGLGGVDRAGHGAASFSRDAQAAACCAANRSANDG